MEEDKTQQKHDPAIVALVDARISEMRTTCMAEPIGTSPEIFRLYFELSDEKTAGQVERYLTDQGIKHRRHEDWERNCNCPWCPVTCKKKMFTFHFIIIRQPNGGPLEFIDISLITTKRD